MKLESQGPRELGERALMQVLNSAANGVGPFKGAAVVADEAMKSSGDVEEAIDRLIRLHLRLAATNGAATSIGGLLTLPVTLPVGVGGYYFIALRLAAAVAYLRGHDPYSDEVQTALLLVALGSSMEAVLKETGVVIGTKGLTAAIAKMPGHVLIEINKAVGFRLVTKFGTKGVVNLGKMVPLVGAPIGGTVDWVLMRAVGGYAKKAFPLVGASGASSSSGEVPGPRNTAAEPGREGVWIHQ